MFYFKINKFACLERIFVLLCLIFIYVFLYTLPKILLDLVQMNFVRRRVQQRPVILDEVNYKEAGKRALFQLKAHVAQSILECIGFILWVSFGFSYLENLSKVFSGSLFLHSLFFFMIFFMIWVFFLFPFEFFRGRIFERKFGANGSLFLFILDSLKGFLLISLFGGLMALGLILFINNFDFWWILGFILMWGFFFLVHVGYPIFIAPFFYSLNSLEDRTLKRRIENLLEHVGFSSKGVFVMNARKPDGRLNAYFLGFGKIRYVILFDTLLKNVSQDGLIAVLGHELGHFKNSDMLRSLLLIGGVIFLLFFVAGVGVEWILDSMGLEVNAGSILSSMVLLGPILLFWLMPLLGVFLRRAEFRADEFAVSLSSKSALANALIRIVNENKSFPCVHPLYAVFYKTHPVLLDRLRALDYEL